MKTTLLRIYSIIVAAICAFAITMYVTQPFLSINICFSPNKEMIESMVGENTEEYNIDVDEILSDVKELNVGVEITPRMLFKSLKYSKADVNKYVADEIIAPNVDRIVDSVIGPISTFAKKIIKSYVEQEIKEQIGDVSEEASEAIIEAVDNIMEKLENEETTTEEFGEVIIEQIDSIASLPEFEEFSAEWDSVTPEEKEEIKNTVVEILNEMQLVDENGKIADMSETINKLIERFLNGEEMPDISDVIPTQSNSGKIKTVYAEGESEYADLKQLIRENISNNLKIPEDMVDFVYSTAIGVTFFYLFLVVTWAWVLLKIIIKLFTKNPGVRVWLPFVFGGGFVGIIFWAIPLILKIGFISSLISGYIPAGLTFAIESSTIYAFFAGVALMVMVLIFGYARIRRKIKSQIKADKKAKA